MQRGHHNRTPSLSSSLADSRSPSPYSRSQSRPQPPYPTTTHHRSSVRWSRSISPDDPLRNSRNPYMPPQDPSSSSSRRRDSFARQPSPQPPQHGGEQKDEKGKDQAKRRPSVSFLKDQIKEKIAKGAKSTAKDDPKKERSSSSSSTLKTSLVFLGSVAAATYVANRFWPRGITYGEKEEWEQEPPQSHDRRRSRGRGRRSPSRQRRQRRRGSFDDDDDGDEGGYRLYRDGGRGAEHVVYGGDESPIRRPPSRGRSDDSRYTVIEVGPARAGSCRPASTRPDPHQSYAENCNTTSRAGDRRRSSSSHYYHHYHDGSERRYYSPARRPHGELDDDEFVVDIDDTRRSTICHEPRYVEHEVTTLRRSSSDDPYTTTERVVRRQYRIDER